jgi:Homeodomain-like domain
MVALVRRGMSMRAVARRFRVSLPTVQRWVKRATGHRLDRVDWQGHSSRPHRTRRTDASLEEAVLRVRQELKEHSDLGEFGAVAIHQELRLRGHTGLPSVRTIGRILARRGVLDARRRPRRRPPPLGWHLPALAAREAELDSFDVVEGLVIEGGPQVEVLTGISLHGGLVAAWPMAAVSAQTTLDALLEHWRTWGLPAFAQFDNDTRFQGPHQHPDAVGRVIRLCLALAVVPVFAPPRETGFQAAIEGFNAQWQAKVWARFHHDSLADLQSRSARYLAAHHRRAMARIEAAPPRRPFPPRWRRQLDGPLRGRIVSLRRTREHGTVQLLGHTFPVDPLWPHRLVRCEVDLDAGSLAFYALRRREPSQQPLLRTAPFVLPPSAAARGR